MGRAFTVPYCTARVGFRMWEKIYCQTFSRIARRSSHDKMMAISWRDRDDKVKGGNEKIFHCEVSKRILFSFGKEVGPVEKEATTFNE